MEFSEKLQELRKRKGLTQEQLAEQLFVSRAAISKWESGRGYPGIDSLKTISKFFSVSIDDLLSGDELISLAEEEQKEKQSGTRAMVFDLLDCGTALLLFLPFCAERNLGAVLQTAVPLLFLLDPLYVKIPCILLIIITVLHGLLTLFFQKKLPSSLSRGHDKISLILSSAAVLAFIAVSQPYAAAFSFFLLLTKVVLLLKRQ